MHPCSVFNVLLMMNSLTAATGISVKKQSPRSSTIPSSLPVSYKHDSALSPHRRVQSREPAGAECLFSRASWMRHRLLHHSITRPQRWLRRILVLEKIDDKVQAPSHNETNGEKSLSFQTVSKDLSLPWWAYNLKDVKETQRLASMKLLLLADLEAIESRTVQLRGQTVNVTEAFPDWRVTNRIDERIRVSVDQRPFEHLSDVVAEHFPCRFHLVDDLPDRSKLLPIVLHVGDWKTSEISNVICSKKELSLEEFLDHWIYLFESLHRQLYKESMKHESMIYVDEICDLSGMNRHQFSPSFVRKIMKPWLSLTQQYYPETTKQIQLLKPPRLLSMVWNTVACMISPGTVAKVQLVSKYDGTVDDFVREIYFDKPHQKT